MPPVNNFRIETLLCKTIKVIIKLLTGQKPTFTCNPNCHTGVSPMWVTHPRSKYVRQRRFLAFH
ncbi:histidinol-phosphate transaminase [Sesbania bispinosa]|nr:histidinol-phosphate transaminase [Sesbania bispinosa]